MTSQHSCQEATSYRKSPHRSGYLNYLGSGSDDAAFLIRKARMTTEHSHSNLNVAEDIAKALLQFLSDAKPAIRATIRLR